MTGIKKSGMSLRQTADSRKKDKSFIVSMVSALLACMTLIFIFGNLTGFSDMKDLWPAFLAGGLFCVLYGAAEYSPFREWFFPAALILLFLFVLLMRTSMVEGFSIWWNQVSAIWTENTGLVLLEFEAGKTGAGLIVFLFFIGSVIGLFCLFLACFVPVLLPVMAVGSLLLGMIFMHQAISFPRMCVVVVCGVLLLFCSGKKKGKSVSPVLIGWGMAAVFVAVLIPLASFDGVRNFAANMSSQIHEKFHEYKYETGHTTLPEGDFTRYTETKEEKQPALIVTGDKLEPMYLRGFTGAVFEENRWTALDNKLMAENKELLYWIQSNEFHLQTQFEKAAESVETEKGSVTIQNTGACSMYQYVPFQLATGEYLQQNRLSTDSLTGDGERTYTYSVILESKDKIIQVLNELQADNKDESQDYRKAESAYRDFVYQYYLQMPEDLKEELMSEWDSLAASYGGKETMTFEQSQECVRRFLEKYFSEDANVDIKMLPLEAAAGTSYQQATAAVMTLRYFGIPARYAEGYIISAEMIEDSEGSVEADSSSAGAWAEVYQDGIGWIPMILTPGLEETAPNENQDNKNDDNVVVKEGEELEEEPEEPLEEPEPEGGTMVKVAEEFMFRYLKYILLLILFVIAVILRRHILVKKKIQRFSVENNSEATAWMVADSVLLLEKMGMKRGNGSLHNLYTEVKGRFDQEYADAYKDVIQANEKALFSSRELDNSSREQVMDFRRKTLQHLKTNTKWYKRIWMKWIQCIY